MCSENEAELIESQHRETVTPPKKWKDALGDLGHNQIVFEHRQAIVTYPAKTEILGDAGGDRVEYRARMDAALAREEGAEALAAVGPVHGISP
jgi:hypothetical protein